MSLHADTNLIFKPFDAPEMQEGEFPQHLPTPAEQIKKMAAVVAKLFGHSLAIGFFVMVGYGFVHGPIAEKPKFSEDWAYQAAVAWVMEK